MNRDYLVSVIIATFNSGKVIKRTLEALRQQTYKNIEILLLDGGSTDNTFALANLYGCKIVDNSKTDPISAKVLGIQKAKGKYVVFLDHDEVMINKKSIEIKVRALQEHQECKAALSSGYLRPKNYPLLNQYLSEYGDPFSLYIYRFSKYYKDFEKVLDNSYKTLLEEEEYKIYSFECYKKNPIIELVCLNTMIDLEYLRKTINIYDSTGKELINAFYIMLELGVNELIVLKNDPLVHYSVDSLKAYFPKLKWRIINNVHYPEKAACGFKGRSEKQGLLIRIKKYFFIPYSLLVIPVLLDSIYLAIKKQNPIYLMHVVFSIYVSCQIIFQYVRKICKCPPYLTSYDGKKRIEENK